MEDNHLTYIFSSPEPKAQKVSLYIPVEPSYVRPWLGGCVNTFIQKYLRDQRADRNQILSEASLRWGKAASGFNADQIRTLVSMAPIGL